MAKKQSILPIIVKALPLIIPIIRWALQHRKKSKSKR